MTKIGKEISVEPVVGTDEPYVLTEEDLPVLYEEYDKLARATCKNAMKATRLTFSILMLHLITGPALPKGWLAAVPGMNILPLLRKAIFTPATSL